MSEKRQAIYYRENYYLLPHGCPTVTEFKNGIAQLPACLRLESLRQGDRVPSAIQKGICIAPYFYSEYGHTEEDVVIEDLSDIYPVEVELLTQAEYNERLREVILAYCPGCLRYKPLSGRVQSLNGHFEEISLNSVCFFRQNSKPAPRAFRSYLSGLGGLWQHFDPCDDDAGSVTKLIRSMLSLKFDAARKDERDPSIMTVSFKPDLFTGVLAATLKRYIENTLTFTQFRIRFDRQPPVTRDEFEKQVNAANRDVMRKNCKKYGVSLAKLTFDPLFGEKVVRSLRPLSDHYYAAELLKEPDAVYLLLLDECEFLKELHFRSPFLEAAGAEIAIYGQYGETRYRISFDMEKLQQA